MTAAPTGTAWSGRDLGAVAAVLACAGLAYGAALAGDFVYDDIHSVSANPAIRDLGNVGRFFTDPGTFSALAANRMYRPVLLTSFALDHSVAGVTAWVFKATNVLLHGMVAALLFALARRWGAGLGAAAAAAALFAVHPLASEAVNLVSGRSEQLVVLFLLLGMHAHRSALAGSRSGPWLAALCGLLACGSKETGVVLPVLLAAQEWAWRQRGGAPAWSPRRGVLRLLPVVAAALGYLYLRGVLFGVATVTLAGRAPVEVTSGHGRDLTTQLATMATLVPRALLQCLVPVGLSLDPPVVFHRGFAELPVLAGIAGLAALVAVGLRRPRGRPLAALGVALAGATSLPWIVIPLNVPLSEHRLYGLLAGVALALAGALASSPFRSVVRARTAALAVAGIVLACLSASRSLDYRDEGTLWRQVLAQEPTSARAWWALGMAQLRLGETGSARVSLATAAALRPSLRSARRAWLESLVESPEDRTAPFLALELAAGLLAESPRDPYLRILQASAELQAGVLTGAPEWFAAAESTALSCLEVGTPKGLVFRVAAEARQRGGDLAGAIALLDRSVAAGLDHYSVLLDRAELLRRAGRRGEAERDLQGALRQAPMDPAVRAALERHYGAGPVR